jgi:hypothetical protein
MGPAIRLAVPAAWACLALCGASPAQRGEEPFFPVSVTYASEPGTARDAIAGDLQSIRGLGFNTITTTLRWSDAEPSRGQYQFEMLDRMFELAAQAGLRVVLRIDTSASPDWLLRRYPDGRFISEVAPTAGGLRGCLDHADLRADALTFVAAATGHVTRHAMWHAVDVGSEPPAGLCSCPHTRRRYKEWSKTSGDADRAAFVRFSRREELKQLIEATSARGARPAASHARIPSLLQPAMGAWPGQDDWQMSGEADPYGTSISSALARGHHLLALALDDLDGATRPRGWWMSADATVPAADARMLAWSAVARGARGLTIAKWREADLFAGVIRRNPALFAQLRPRPARIAILYDPRGKRAGGAGESLPDSDYDQIVAVYRALFARNIPVDFVHHDEAASGRLDGYRVIVGSSHDPLPAQVAEAVKARAAAGSTFVDAAREKLTADRVVQLALEAGVAPDVRLDTAHGLVETRFLESRNVLMLIGINHGDWSQKVTMRFAPDTQEAIWVNLETGAGVNFVAGPDGPTYNYWFRPRDALVLMIRKDIR